MRLTNPGRYPTVDTNMSTPYSQTSVAAIISAADNFIARGAGQGISDGALNDTLVVSTRALDRMLSFDRETGVLTAEAGTILADIAESFAPRGWFLPTTPGTNQISLGGAVASDVHGKNHHSVGSFGRHVLWLEVLTAAQGVVRCSPTQHCDLFYATCGGNGLTGLILVVAIQMVSVPSNWIKQIGIKTRCLSETLDACEEHLSYAYSVAWIDSHARGNAMGRGYLMCGNFAQEHEVDPGAPTAPARRPRGPALRLPIYFPVPTYDFTLWTEAINTLYSIKARNGPVKSMVPLESFFFPLQALNLKVFGGAHITYQFVLPYDAAREGFVRVFKTIVESSLGSMISVLKLFGHQEQPPGNISFPMAGFNLGIDFRVSPAMFRLFRELDAMVLDFGGRHYLAKDVCLSPESFRRGYGKSVDEFLAVKAKWDPDNRFRSLQSMRLQLY